jgi:hypothetical protein
MSPGTGLFDRKESGFVGAGLKPAPLLALLRGELNQRERSLLGARSEAAVEALRDD